MRNPTRTVRFLTVAMAVLAVVASLQGAWQVPGWYAVPLLVLGVALTESAVVSLQFGRQTWTFSLTESVLAVALVAGPGAWITVGVALGVLLAQLYLKRPRLKKHFNIAMFAAASAAAELVASASGGQIRGAVAGLAAFFLVNQVLLSIAVSATTNRPFVPLIVTSLPLMAVHMAGNSSIGLLAAFLAGTAPLGLLGLLVPLALLWSSYDQQTRRSQEARLFAELAAGQERAAGRSRDVSAQAVVSAAARLFGGADVEMVLRAADGAVRYVGDEVMTPQRVRVDSDVFDEPWVMRALRARGVSTGVDQGRPWCSALLGDPNDPQAALIARRPHGSAAFGRREVMLAEVLVGQADSWLSVADLSDRAKAAQEHAEAAEDAARALGDLGAATAPALLVLRESATRLARLAENDGRVDDIVDELHLVERAVASLLGAIALAADPDLAQGPNLSGAAPARATTDWTTTGVLR